MLYLEKAKSVLLSVPRVHALPGKGLVRAPVRAACPCSTWKRLSLCSCPCNVSMIYLEKAESVLLSVPRVHESRLLAAGGAPRLSTPR